MSTVTLVEVNTPVSLRTCGSSISSLAQRRSKLQCFSPDKRAAAIKARTPDLRGGRVSVSPKVFGLEGTQIVSSPTESPIPSRPCITPYSGCHSRFQSEEVYGSDSLEEFTDDDLDLGIYVEPDEVGEKPQLCVQGSRQRLFGPYDIPNLKTLEKKSATFTEDASKKQTNRDAAEREGATSPGNPPPSPINFYPSLDGFVVGGQKLACPEKSGTTQEVWSCNSRDFKPGVVKYPMYQCNKCADRVVEEEQTEVALQRRRSCLLNSRISSHRHHDDPPLSVSSRLGRDSSMLMSPLGAISPGFVYPDPHNLYGKTFQETYLKKKREKEERDRQLEEERRTHLNRVRNGETETRRQKQRNQGTTEYQLDQPADSYQPDMSDEYFTTDAEKVSDFQLKVKPSCSQPIRLHKDRCKSPDFCPNLDNDELEMRCCKSDICPFPDDMEFNKQNETDLFTYDLKNFRSTSRITPLYPLVRPSPMNAIEGGNTRASPDLSRGQGQFKHGITSLKAEADYTGNRTALSAEHQHTMTATVLVPSPNTPCDQWVSLTTDNEPVLNNSPDVEDGCDTFLKRLQRSKLSNTDQTLPSGQQFCFEAVVDKRYNRWKRRRRRKKEGELRRSKLPGETESSDDDAGRNAEVEHILEKMYDQIHGPAPRTPNGSRDTPRLRNRRRRTELTESKNDVNATSLDTNLTYYDASSEYTSSDKDSGALSSNSGLGQSTSALWQCSDTMVNTSLLRRSAERKPSEDACYWPLLEEYKEQILKTIQNTPSEQLEEMDQKHWLPDITVRFTGRHSGASQRSVHDGKEIVTPILSSPLISSDDSAPDSVYSGTRGTMTRDEKDMYKEGDKSNQHQARNLVSSSTKPGSRNLASTREETGGKRLNLGTNQKSARQIGVVTLGVTGLDSSFEASLRPIKHVDDETNGQIKGGSKHVREQQSMTKGGLNLPALTKNPKSQTLLQPLRRDVAIKPKKKSKSFGKTAIVKPPQQRPKTQPYSIKGTARTGDVDSSFIVRDYYLKNLYNDRVKANLHVGPGKKLKKTLTADQLDLGGRKTRTGDNKLHNLAFTRSFTFSMFDLPDVYKMYNSNLVHLANGEVIDTSD